LERKNGNRKENGPRSNNLSTDHRRGKKRKKNWGRKKRETEAAIALKDGVRKKRIRKREYQMGRKKGKRGKKNHASKK